jgi:Tfp pilus assembly PilM family ATPase
MIKAAQLARVRGRWQLRAAASLPRGGDPGFDGDRALDVATVARLADVLDRRGFDGRRVVLCVPPAKMESDMLDLPPRASGAPLEQIARSEMGRVAALQNLAFESACWDLPAPARASAATSVLAVAVRHSDADALVEPFDVQGLDVLALDTASWALARATSPCAGPPDQITAVVDLGFSGAVLALVSDGLVVYHRYLTEAGVGPLHHALIERFDAPEDAARSLLIDPSPQVEPAAAAWIAKLIANYVDQLIEELQVSFAFAAHRYPALPLRKLLLTGGGAALAGLADGAHARLSVDVAVPCAKDLVDVPPGLCACETTTGLATAIGLALHGQGQGRWQGGAP